MVHRIGLSADRSHLNSRSDYRVPNPNGTVSPAGITTGPDGALWFTDYAKIGRITTAGVVTNLYLVPGAPSVPFLNGIVAGPDGALWFAEGGSGQIGRITTAGVFTQYSIPTSGAFPYAIIRGPGNLLWFTERDTGKIASITMAGVVAEYPVPGTSAGPTGITVGPGHTFWFTDYSQIKIGEVVFATATLTVSPANGSFGTSLTFAGSGFSPNEEVKIYSQGIGSPVLIEKAADAAGSFTATAGAPNSVYGPRLFLCQGQSSGKTAATSFSAETRVIVTPNSGEVGNIATVTGFGFAANETVQVYWDNTQTNLGLTSANVDGTFSGSAAIVFTVPFGATPGTHTIEVNGSSQGMVTGLTADVQFVVR